MIRRKMFVAGSLGLVGMALPAWKTPEKHDIKSLHVPVGKIMERYSRRDYELSNGDSIRLHFFSEKHEADLWWRHTCLEVELTEYSPTSSPLWFGLRCHKIIETWVQSGQIELILSGKYSGFYDRYEFSGGVTCKNHKGYRDFVQFRESYHKRTV